MDIQTPTRDWITSLNNNQLDVLLRLVIIERRERRIAQQTKDGRHCFVCGGPLCKHLVCNSRCQACGNAQQEL